MDRRSFIGNVSGLFGVALASPIIDAIPEQKQKTNLDVEYKLNNNANQCLSLHAKYGHMSFQPSGREVMRIESSGYTGLSLKPSNWDASHESKVVSMKPGPDGELYLKINDKWKKVVTV